MFYFKEYVKKYNIDNQLPSDVVFATNSHLMVDGIDYRLCVYGWPYNRVAFANKVTGVNTIKRFGATGRDKCNAFLKLCLEVLGVEFPEEEK
jgi:hypothetical protein